MSHPHVRPELVEGRHLSWPAIAGVLICSLPSTVLAGSPVDTALRVCADPNNPPQSTLRGDGYENRIAAALARDLGRTVEYTFFPQRMGFVRNTLRARDEATQRFKCDVIIGVPTGYELTATTRPYMHSTYALVLRRGLLDAKAGAEDLVQLPSQQLKTLRIGIFARSPASDWLLGKGLIEQAVIYPQQSGDPAEHPASVVKRDLEAGSVDAAILWGPMAAYLIAHQPADDAWIALPFRRDPLIKFDYDISMGVRFGEREWKDALDAWIDAHRDEIHAILGEYSVPLLDAQGNVLSAP